jgi:hypothetical protein
MEIRRATEEDKVDVISILCQMHEDSEFELSAINPRKLHEIVIHTINDGVVYVAVKDSEIIGSIGGLYSSDWWSNEKFLGDLWFYVYKEERNTRAGTGLIKKFMEAGNGMQLRLGHVYGGDMERKDNFYERLGLLKAGTYYVTERK